MCEWLMREYKKWKVEFKERFDLDKPKPIFSKYSVTVVFDFRVRLYVSF